VQWSAGLHADLQSATISLSRRYTTMCIVIVNTLQACRPSMTRAPSASPIRELDRRSLAIWKGLIPRQLAWWENGGKYEIYLWEAWLSPPPSSMALYQRSGRTGNSKGASSGRRGRKLTSTSPLWRVIYCPLLGVVSTGQRNTSAKFSCETRHCDRPKTPPCLILNTAEPIHIPHAGVVDETQDPIVHWE
jgi:hypothetical protein